jgi:hypothetical protein
MDLLYLSLLEWSLRYLIHETENSWVVTYEGCGSQNFSSMPRIFFYNAAVPFFSGDSFFFLRYPRRIMRLIGKDYPDLSSVRVGDCWPDGLIFLILKVKSSLTNYYFHFF